MTWVVQVFSLIWHQNFMWDHSNTAVLKDVLGKKEPFWKYVSFISKHIDIIGIIIQKTNKKEYYKCIHLSDPLLGIIILTTYCTLKSLANVLTLYAINQQFSFEWNWTLALWEHSCVSRRTCGNMTIVLANSAVRWCCATAPLRPQIGP